MAQVPEIDSRNGAVQLDYDNLIISSPTEFTKAVTFSDDSLAGVTTTWPRGVRIVYDGIAYVASARLEPVVPANYNIVDNTFTSIAPPLNTSSYIVTTGITTPIGHTFIQQSGYYHIEVEARSNIPTSALGDKFVEITGRSDLIAGWTSLCCSGVSAQGSVVSPLMINTHTTRYITAGSQVRIAFAGSDNQNVIFTLTIIKLR